MIVRGRLCRRLVIKLTSCSSRHWFLLQLNVIMAIIHLLSLVNGISRECRKNAKFSNFEQIQCELKTNIVVIREAISHQKCSLFPTKGGGGQSHI